MIECVVIFESDLCMVWKKHVRLVVPFSGHQDVRVPCRGLGGIGVAYSGDNDKAKQRAKRAKENMMVVTGEPGRSVENREGLDLI
jgi:hypothetical protein